MFWPRAPVISDCNTDDAAAEPNRGERMPFTATDPLDVTWYCTAFLPARYTALPDAPMLVKVALPLPDANRSPMRPPQPEVAPSGEDDCQ